MSAAFTYSIKKDNGYRSKMTGRLRNPDHHAVVEHALLGNLVDSPSNLLAAGDLLAAAKLMVAVYDQSISGLQVTRSIEALREAISKAEAKA